MPVPAPNLYPDFNTIRLSHVCLNVKDLGASKTFYTEILGLQVTTETDSHVYLRAMEERGHHCVILQKSDQPGTVEVMGFKTFDDEDLDKAEAYFKGKGRPTQWVERAFQGRTLLTSDNMGIPLEFYHKMDRLEPIHQKYALYRGVKPLRIDHFNVFSHDVDASVAFYSDFGFRVTEYTEDEESKKLWAAWMHRKGGVHDMAFTNGTGPADAPCRLLGADAAEHHRPSRSDVDDRICGQHRTRSGAARHFQCLLPLYPRPRWAPD